MDHREVDPRLKVRREANARRLGHGGTSHCFNYNKDGHFQALCTNPPSATTVGRMTIEPCHA
jgi:hypothetical protein